jgi:hypothetical protein
MANLAPLSINTSYPGLLNLQTATTGITSSVQSIQDGLGNDTGLQIAENYLGGSSLQPFYQAQPNTTYGLGITSGVGIAFNAGCHNMLQSQVFYDAGVVVYSAITFAVGTITTTSDTCELGIYSSQVLQDGTGVQPKDRLVNLGSLSAVDLGTTGFKKIVFPSPIAFGKGGAHFICFVITNAGSVAPTFRFRGIPSTSSSYVVHLGTMYGFVLDAGGSLYNNIFRAGTSQQLGQLYGGTTGALLASYGTGVGSTGSSTAQSIPGFVLHASI